MTTNVVIIECTNEGKRYTFFLMRYIILIYILFFLNIQYQSLFYRIAVIFQLSL
jgi:hypothetical protein